MRKSGNKFIFILAMLIFGSIGLFVRKIPIPSLHIAFIRSFVGTFVMISIYVFLKKKIDREAVLRNRYNLLFGGAFLGINWILLFEAYKNTTITSATLAYYMAPILFILLSTVVFRVKLTGIRILTILLAFLGLVVLQMKDVSVMNDMESRGILFGLAAAFFYALVIIFNRRMRSISGMDRTFMELFLSLLVLSVYMLFTGEFAAFYIPLEALPYALILGIVHTGLAYYLYFSTVDRLDSQYVALLSYMDPLSAIVFSVILLGEVFYFNMAMGALLILGASILFDLLGKKEEKMKRRNSS